MQIRFSGLAFVIGLAMAAVMFSGSSPAKADPPTPLNLPPHTTAVPRGNGPSFPVWASSQDAGGTKNTGTTKGQGNCGSCWALRTSIIEPEAGTVVATFTDEDACFSFTITQTGGNAWVWDDGVGGVYDLYADGTASDPGVEQDFRKPNGDYVSSFSWSDGAATVISDQNSDGVRDLVIDDETVLSVSRTWDSATHTSATTYDNGLVVTALRRTEQPGTMGWRAILAGAPGHSSPVTATVNN